MGLVTMIEFGRTNGESSGEAVRLAFVSAIIMFPHRYGVQVGVRLVE